ncbi:MAG: DUF4139 domain-containing protein [Candidatus Electrothrix aestuarii]|uniref:DUF4139 domain-containing protein n=1 Tax=Candidatus Electrothrix aestuarii TaxID=3062594 RepID=A0AAU8LXI7_9BACT|nr:DUF4139 domain-containing protein [Candidatus Electrothrix aestuarii]
MTNALCLCLLALFPFSLAFAMPENNAEEIISSLDDQTSVAVTIYNQDLALIRDSRKLTLQPGQQTLAFREVSAKIRPQTALLAAPGLQVLEQNFEYDLLSPQSLLEKYVGQQVTLVTTHPTTGEESQQEATVLSNGSGTVLRVGDHIESGVPGRLIFPSVPENLRDRPTLTMLVDNKTTEAQPVVLSYLTSGLSWQADYVAELGEDDTTLDLNGWVTLKNESGATYENAQLKLVAGDVNRVRERVQPLAMMRSAPRAEADMAAGMAEESMFEYHLYTLGRPTTIKEKQSKQVALMQANNVQVKKEFILDGQNYYYSSQVGDLGKKLKVGVFVEMKNSKEAGIGQPLPAGIMRVYKKDSSGSLQFVGEDRIDHTPENETIRLKLGDAFDVTADKKQTDFKKLAGFSRFNYVYETAFEIVLKNAKEEAVTVRVQEPVPGDWEIIEESAPHDKESASAAVWHITVEPKSNTTLTWRVKVKY